jgi:hypothetical protein
LFASMRMEADGPDRGARGLPAQGEYVRSECPSSPAAAFSWHVRDTTKKDFLLISRQLPPSYP